MSSWTTPLHVDLPEPGEIGRTTYWARWQLIDGYPPDLFIDPEAACERLYFTGSPFIEKEA